MKNETRKELVSLFYPVFLRGGWHGGWERIECNMTREEECLRVANQLTDDEEYLRKTVEDADRRGCWTGINEGDDRPFESYIIPFKKAIAENEAERIRKIFTDGLLKNGIPTDEIQKMADIAYPL